MTTTLEKMTDKMKSEGLYPTKFIEKIAKAKERFFSEEEWMRCPCDAQNPERFCISPMCKADIEKTGHCHCNCYTNKECTDE